jgi:hypothetical protein
MMSALARARHADADARDAIARLLDAHLSSCRTVRTLSAQLLTRPLARGEPDAPLAPSMARRAFARRVRRVGGASLVALRDEILLVRLAAILHDPSISWGIAAEVLGARGPAILLRGVRRARQRSPHLWRKRITPGVALDRLAWFLARNAPKWREAAEEWPSRRCPRCGHVFPVASPPV